MLTLLEKVLTIEKKSLRNKMGRINDNIVQQVSRAWMMIGGIETEPNKQIISDKYIIRGDIEWISTVK